MPQMMPLNWLILMIQFISIFFMISIMIYFIPLPKSLNFGFTKKSSINWKW